MRILYFYQYFGTPKGSWSTRVYELCVRWVAKGHEVTVVTAPYEKSDIVATRFVDKMVVDGINLIVINAGDSNRDPTWKRAIRALQFSLVSCWYALTLKYDRVICSSGPITIGLPGILAHKLRGKKMIFEIRDLWPAGGIEMGKIKPGWQSALALWFEKKCYLNSSLLVTCSPDQRDHILARFPGIPAIVIPNASDPDLFGVETRESLPEWTTNKILYSHIGSLGFIHNCTLLVDAARKIAELKYDDLVVVFLGEGVERKKLESMVESYRLSNVKFMGLLPKNRLPVWVQRSHATLFSTLNNPVQNSSSPNKVFDSFAAGTPVIQTTTGWIGRLIDREQCGINVPPDDATAMAHAMILLANDSARRAELSRNSTRVARTLFNRTLLAEKYIEAIEKT